jgi:hypothetical protein
MSMGSDIKDTMMPSRVQNTTQRGEKMQALQNARAGREGAETSRRSNKREEEAGLDAVARRTRKEGGN